LTCRTRSDEPLARAGEEDGGRATVVAHEATTPTRNHAAATACDVLRIDLRAIATANLRRPSVMTRAMSDGPAELRSGDVDLGPGPSRTLYSVPQT
jgi:hypothetical protein